MNKIKLTIFLGFVVFFIAATNSYAAMYNCIVIRVAPNPNGNVALVDAPGASETRFTGEGKATISVNDPGAKNMYATVLTAVSLNKEVGIILPEPPSATNQIMDGVSLITQ